MKKLILSAIMLSAATVTVNAQANSILIYGNAGYHSTKDFNDYKTRSYNITPGIGYQFDNHWTVGVYGAFGNDRSNELSVPGNSIWRYSNTYEAGAFVRHTIGLGKIFAIYNQLNAGYIGNTSGVTNYNNGDNFTANGFHANLTPYVGVNVYKGFALNFSFGGLDYKTSSGSGANSHSFDVTFGSQISVGVSKNFACGGHRKHHHAKHNNDSNVEEIIMDDKNE